MNKKQTIIFRKLCVITAPDVLNVLNNYLFYTRLTVTKLYVDYCARAIFSLSQEKRINELKEHIKNYLKNPKNKLNETKIINDLIDLFKTNHYTYYRIERILLKYGVEALYDECNNIKIIFDNYRNIEIKFKMTNFAIN